MQNYNSKLKIIFFLVFFTFSFLIFNLNEVKAQSLSLGISPPVLEVLIKPGKTITQAYKLINNGEDVIITPRLAEMGEDGVTDNPEYQPEPWITLLNTDVFLNKPFLFESKKEKQIVLKIAPPKGMTEEEIYRVLLFTTTPLPPGETSQSSVSSSLGTILLISVTSTAMQARGAQITEFDLPGIIDSFDPLVANISVKNSGKTYFRPMGKIMLSGSLGKSEYDIRPNVILAGKTRKLTTSVSEDEDVTLRLPGFYIGKYSLTMGFTLNESNIKIEQTKTFYAVPWKASITLLVIGLILYRIVKRKKKD